MQQKHMTRIFFWPLIIAGLSLAGLIFALVYDDARECLANAAIAIPVLVAIFYYWFKPWWMQRESRFR